MSPPSYNLRDLGLQVMCHPNLFYDTFCPTFIRFHYFSTIYTVGIMIRFGLLGYFLTNFRVQIPNIRVLVSYLQIRPLPASPLLGVF